MKVILIENVQGLGKKYEIKEVADGYARNFLIPKNMVKIATKEALTWLETQKDIIEKHSQEELKETQELASKLDGYELLIKVKIGDKGQLFEKITNSKISDNLRSEGFEVDKKQINFTEEINELGEYPVKIKLDHNLEADIKVIITEEE